MAEGHELKGRRVLVTGATGLIGAALCRRLAAEGAEVLAFVRNPEKARAKLPAGVECLVGDMRRPIVCEGPVDYIVHAAGETASRAFVERPVEVIEATVAGVRQVLDLAAAKSCAGVVFLSTMEVYGLTDSENVTETDYAALDPMIPRNCYPEAKRLAECLCASTARERGLRVMVARLTQTFGAGVEKGDRRVFAQFAAAAAAGEDIVLKSAGATARCYCSVSDAVEAIRTILLRGEAGTAYNVANPATFCTVREMAELVAGEFSRGRSKVVVDASDAEGCGYLPPFRMRLNVDRLTALGWRPRQSLREMYAEMIASLCP